LERAEQEGIAALALFAPQQFNVEIGIALPLRWLSRGGIETGLTLSAILEPLEDRTIGIDGGGLGEFARFSHAGPGEGLPIARFGGTHLLFPKVWSAGRRAQ
jgi:hypothetical protein